MAGIKSYGARIPRYRMDKKEISAQLGWFGSRGKGEKAVANHDEDSITLGYAAAYNCLLAAGNPGLQGLYFASLSMPFVNRQNSGVIAGALQQKQLKLADFGGSVRAGMQALLSALDGAAGGDYLAIAADSRAAKPGSPGELSWGDGAASFLLGSENTIADCLGSLSIAADFIDNRQTSGAKFDRTWEERWIRDEGFMKTVPKLFYELLAKTGKSAEDISKVVVASANNGIVRALPKALKIDPEKLQNNYGDTVGDTGTALSYIMLCDALDNASPGDLIAVLNFGYGADAVLFEVTPEIENFRGKTPTVASMAENKVPFAPYVRYLAYKDLIPLEEGIRGESVSPTALSMQSREGDAVSALEGVRCKKCGAPQYPKHKICVSCQGMDMEPYSFIGKELAVISFTADYLAFSYDPPQLYGMLDCAGGGRLMLDFTDCTPAEIKVGVKMQPTFRRKYFDKGRDVITYYWKAAPVK